MPRGATGSSAGATSASCSRARRRIARTSSVAGSSGSSRRARSSGEVTRGQRAAYSLTEAGIQALPVMVAMATGPRASRRHLRAAGVCRAAPRRRSRADRAIPGRAARGPPRHPHSDPDRPRSSMQQAAYEAAGDLISSRGTQADGTTTSQPCHRQVKLRCISTLVELRGNCRSPAGDFVQSGRRMPVGQSSRPGCALQHSNTDQQMSFRNLWSSRTSSRIASGG